MLLLLFLSVVFVYRARCSYAEHFLNCRAHSVFDSFSLRCVFIFSPRCVVLASRDNVNSLCLRVFISSSFQSLSLSLSPPPSLWTLNLQNCFFVYRRLPMCYIWRTRPYIGQRINSRCVHVVSQTARVQFFALAVLHISFTDIYYEWIFMQSSSFIYLFLFRPVFGFREHDGRRRRASKPSSRIFAQHSFSQRKQWPSHRTPKWESVF